jgi:hypothetical protein
MLFPIFIITLSIVQVYLGFMPLSLLVILLMGFYIFSTKTEIGFKDVFSKNKYFFLFILLIIISLLRSGHPELSMKMQFYKIIYLITFLLFFIKLFINYTIENKFTFIENIYNFVIIPFTCHLILNIILSILGVKIGEEVLTGEAITTNSVLLGSIGFNSARIQFPLSGGFNNYAAIVGAILSMSLCYFFFIKKNQILISINIILSIIVLFFVDSRSCLISPFLVLLLFYGIKNFKKISFLTLSMLWFFFGTLALIIILPLLAELSFIENITRSASDLATGNARFLIWGIAFLEFLDFKVIHIFGYGEFGHYKSGASIMWSLVFSTFENSELKTPHNTLLIMLFDIGYFGVLIFLIWIMKTMNWVLKYWRNNKNISFLFLSFFLFHLFVGNSESLIFFYTTNYFYLFIAIFIAIFVERLTVENYDKKISSK